MDPRRSRPAPRPQSGSRINVGYLGKTVGSKPIIWLMGFPRAAQQHPADHPSPISQRWSLCPSTPAPGGAPRRLRITGGSAVPRLQGPHCSASRGTLKMLQDLLPAKTAWEGGGDSRWKDIILLETAQITQAERVVWIVAGFLSSFFFLSFFFLSFPPLLSSPGPKMNLYSC